MESMTASSKTIVSSSSSRVLKRQRQGWTLTALLVFTTFHNSALAFTPSPTQSIRSSNLHASSNNNDSESQSPRTTPPEAEALLARAKALRDSLPPDTHTNDSNVNDFSSSSSSSPWSCPPPPADTVAAGYRLYVDIGREEGTWMDPRWGASGRRIEFSLDVSLLRWKKGGGGTDIDVSVDPEVQKSLLQSMPNLRTQNVMIQTLWTAPKARLRGGFDSMPCHNGGYYVDRTSTSSSSSTIRFGINVEGTSSATYGDVSIPKGYLYFSLPCFGSGAAEPMLSTREGTVTIRERGWHTGWYREESRIVGVFRAVDISRARERDGF